MRCSAVGGASPPWRESAPSEQGAYSRVAEVAGSVGWGASTLSTNLCGGDDSSLSHTTCEFYDIVTEEKLKSVSTTATYGRYISYGNGKAHSIRA